MQEVRFKAIRRKISRLRFINDDSQKVRMIRALYIIVFNAEESLIPLATELFHTIGEILEGTPPEELPLHRVHKATFLKTYNDLTQKTEVKKPNKRKGGKDDREEEKENFA
jgi:hypothetical protein